MRHAVQDVIDELGSMSRRSAESDGGRGGALSAADPNRGTVNLICLDEFQVGDTFTAIALKALFECLWDANKDYYDESRKRTSEAGERQRGSDTSQDAQVNNNVNIIVATTNRNIDCDNDITSGLGGDHMAMVLPAMRERMISLRLERDIDYRSVMLERDSSTGGKGNVGARTPDAYFVNGVNVNKEPIGAFWDSLHGSEERCVDVDVSYGRTFNVPRRKTLRTAEGAAGSSDVEPVACCIDFRSLCDDDNHPMSPYDYMALAKQFDLVMLVGVPVMSRKTKDKARRFINFVDEMYNNRTALVLNSEREVDALFRANADDAFDSSLLDDMDASDESQQVEQLQFESEPEQQRLRTDLTAFGGRGILSDHAVRTGRPRKGGAGTPGGANAGASSVTTATLRKMLSGEDERFAFRRALSRLKEMRSRTYKETSKWRKVLPYL